MLFVTLTTISFSSTYVVSQKNTDHTTSWPKLHQILTDFQNSLKPPEIEVYCNIFHYTFSAFKSSNGHINVKTVHTNMRWLFTCAHFNTFSLLAYYLLNYYFDFWFLLNFL